MHNDVSNVFRAFSQPALADQFDDRNRHQKIDGLKNELGNVVIHWKLFDGEKYCQGGWHRNGICGTLALICLAVDP